MTALSYFGILAFESCVTKSSFKLKHEKNQKHEQISAID